MFLVGVFLVSASPIPPVILVSFDGFRYDYLHNRTDTPNFDFMIKHGCWARDGMENVFVSKTFPNHYTLVTGLWEESHGIVANSMRDADLGSFRLGSKGVSEPRWWNGGEPIWVTAELQGRRSATLFWPGSDVAIRGVRPSLYYAYNGSMPYSSRVRQVLDWLALPHGERPDIITLYLDEPDHTGHIYGPHAPEVTTKIKAVDAILGELLDGLRGMGLLGSSTGSPANNDGVNLLVLSDHGMATLSTSRLITLSDYCDTTLFTISDRLPVVAIWPNDGSEAGVERVFGLLQGKHPRMRVYKKQDLPARYHYSNHKRIAPILAVPDIGWVIQLTHPPGGDTTALSLGDTTLLGTHGYDPRNHQMRPIFLGIGPSFHAKLVVPPFQNVHIYSLLCRLLRLQPAPNNGTASAVDHLLRRRGDGGQAFLWRATTNHAAATGDGAGGNSAYSTYDPDPTAHWDHPSDAVVNRSIWRPAFDRLSVTPVDGADLVEGGRFDVQATAPMHMLRALGAQLARWQAKPRAQQPGKIYDGNRAAKGGVDEKMSCPRDFRDIRTIALETGTVLQARVQINEKPVTYYCQNLTYRPQQNPSVGVAGSAAALLVTEQRSDGHIGLVWRGCSLSMDTAKTGPSAVTVKVELWMRLGSLCTHSIHAGVEWMLHPLQLSGTSPQRLPSTQVFADAMSFAAQDKGTADIDKGPKAGFLHLRPRKRAKNIILAIGDGMSLPMLTAARMIGGARNGKVRRPLQVDAWPDSAASASTYNTGHKTSDGAMGVYPDVTTDANKATARLSARQLHVPSKTAKFDGEEVLRGADLSLDNPRVETLAERLRRQLGKRVGIVTTADLTDATPAAIFIHTSDRSLGPQIAADALSFAPDVMLGGGRKQFDGSKKVFTQASGVNTGADLLPMFKQKGYHIIENQTDLAMHVNAMLHEHGHSSGGTTEDFAEHMATTMDMDMDISGVINDPVTTTHADPGKDADTGWGGLDAGTAWRRRAAAAHEKMAPARLLGLFHEGTMDVWLDRNAPAMRTNLKPRNQDQPGLSDMAVAALRVLQHNVEMDEQGILVHDDGTGRSESNPVAASNSNADGNADAGFFLLLEAASIDKQAHACDSARMLGDTIELQSTLRRVQLWLEANGLADDTLIVTTSDHATGGYDVYGAVNVDAFNAAVDPNTAAGAGTEPPHVSTEEDQRRQFAAAQAKRLSAVRKYGEARWPDYVDGDNDMFPDNFVSARWVLAGVNANHPAYYENFQTSGPHQGKYNGYNGIPLAENLDADTHEAVSVHGAVHTASDVLIFATGPGSEFFARSMDNTEVFFGMLFAAFASPLAATTAPSLPPSISPTAAPTPSATLSPSSSSSTSPATLDRTGGNAGIDSHRGGEDTVLWLLLGAFALYSVIITAALYRVLRQRASGQVSFGGAAIQGGVTGQATVVDRVHSRGRQLLATESSLGDDELAPNEALGTTL